MKELLKKQLLYVPELKGKPNCESYTIFHLLSSPEENRFYLEKGEAVKAYLSGKHLSLIQVEGVKVSKDSTHSYSLYDALLEVDANFLETDRKDISMLHFEMELRPKIPKMSDIPRTENKYKINLQPNTQRRIGMTDTARLSRLPALPKRQI